VIRYSEQFAGTERSKYSMKNIIKKNPNFNLRREREWHSLSQQQVAEYIGTTPLSVSRWERGIVLPGPHFRRALCSLFKKNPYELGFVSVEEHTPDAINMTMPSVPQEYLSHTITETPAALGTDGLACWKPSRQFHAHDE
jgi:transcriptional regulator with XRE-family HTH domain